MENQISLAAAQLDEAKYELEMAKKAVSLTRNTSDKSALSLHLSKASEHISIAKVMVDDLADKATKLTP